MDISTIGKAECIIHNYTKNTMTTINIAPKITVNSKVLKLKLMHP